MMDKRALAKVSVESVLNRCGIATKKQKRG